VPNLREDASTGLVYGGGDGLPGFDLLLGPETGDLRVADALGRDGCAFGEDETGGGALPVVVDHDRGGDVVGGAAKPGQRRHDDTVGQGEIADLQGIK